MGFVDVEALKDSKFPVKQLLEKRYLLEGGFEVHDVERA